MHQVQKFIRQAPFNGESLVVALTAAICGVVILLVYPRYALLAPAVVFGWTQIPSG